MATRKGITMRLSHPTSPATLDPRWAAVVARDPAADGQFVYAVRTTGVYGRPSSAARLPRPENVEFFDSAAEAEAAGYRPSRHVAADQTQVGHQHADVVARVCRLIDASDEVPPLARLAERAGMSPYHFHRVFKAVTGVTPKAYAEAQRARRVREHLAADAQAAGSVTDAIYASGFNSNSRFYANSRQMLGMTPRDYKAGGANQEIRFAVAQCSLGAILVARSDAGICAIQLDDDPDALVRALQDRFPRAELIGADAAFEALVAQVIGLVEAPALGATLPLDVRGTAFQERVWRALREIPVGQTATYADIARRIGAPGAVRAVAQACGANPVAVAIPCHRVVRTDGGLSGYRWGVARKQELLRREGAWPAGADRGE
ncbi:bifunctional DNA-binding transcriptional regulator/O6-methylguanine-DNA methyltransferase Ada [Bordetella genomosp. 1]|nr:bifunctional DNA-binding transcriptional regulator/O6-methylguanine-DNA methyltransferase Ada [Bordetella genomosp. 1]